MSFNGNPRSRPAPVPDRSTGILGGRPAHLTSGLDVVTDDIARQAPVDALVEKDPHDAASITRSFASSKKAMTCLRVAEGNPSTTFGPEDLSLF
jgi:hypothetical protein